jgi:hypothetical protein
MDLDDLYDKMGELLEKADEMCGGDSDVNDPSDAIDALTDLIDEKGASKKITSLIDEIADVNDKIDELEAEEFYNQLDDDDMMFESKKKVIKITESDLMRITNKVIKEQSKKIRRK